MECASCPPDLNRKTQRSSRSGRCLYLGPRTLIVGIALHVSQARIKQSFFGVATVNIESSIEGQASVYLRAERFAESHITKIDQAGAGPASPETSLRTVKG